MTLSVAIVGSGMGGLAAAHFCRQNGCEVTVFEEQPGWGMDAHAVPVHGSRVDVPLRVMNSSAWNSVLSLAADVGVGTYDIRTLISCSRSDRSTWFRSGRFPFTDRHFVGSLRYLDRRALRVVRTLYRLSRAAQALPDQDEEMLLRDYLAREDLDPQVWRGMVLPMLITICTCDEEHLLDWPAGQLFSLLRDILDGPGLVRLQGGTSALVDALSRDLRRFSGSAVVEVVQRGDQVSVANARGDGGLFDRVILATQANQLDFLDDGQFGAEREVLSGIRFADGELVTHSDERFMPRDPRDWTALNFQTDAAMDRVMFTVWINAVEPGMPPDAPVFQTWNPIFPPADDRVIDRTPLQRAVVHAGTDAVLREMDRWHRAPGRRVFYCGSWAYEGVPLLETAVQSARRVAELATGPIPPA
ncbi:MAG: FAD-binding protein [Thioalkalivibrio sp.]|nr:MAG: FAD-binding protein [Thioalkalivibrio sp.]